MGGAVCRILVKATLRFDAVPTQPAELKDFDKQMREVYANPEFAQSVVNDTDDATAVCEILDKNVWGTGERQRLLHVIDEICGGYA